MPENRISALLIAFLAASLIVSSCGRARVQVPAPETLAGQATIRRDTFGVPHILADTEEAAAFAFGYAQAEDHAAGIGRQIRKYSDTHLGPVIYRNGTHVFSARYMEAEVRANLEREYRP
jgi:hypothetical protein